ncbi:hypothetical protein TomTYG75_22100 [Sphingobium sp. TomTYG75]
MQAIGALERAVSRLEQDVQGLAVAGPASSASSGMDPVAARAALRSLDELIADLKGDSRG